MGFSRFGQEGTRNEDEIDSRVKEVAVELREAQVVANGETDSAHRSVDWRNDFGAWLGEGAFLESRRTLHLDVEHVGFPVNCPDLALRIQEHVRVVDAGLLRDPLLEAPEAHPKLELLGPLSALRDDGAV